ncbi:uncharacterized protein L203_103814 [Cryptococcus depauperatus CBS 7841]|uniref:Uncharacterized protein n=1 Tax=Cryptococcus depauperatus CBS 7841 TaxID=1295531 RepID=A0A1E3IE95_9TREE|nr:solute carrier family 35 (UDP-sugar transporter), member A1/2/3 [Cryptococcus depauperatus CBS 7841]
MTIANPTGASSRLKRRLTMDRTTSHPVTPPSSSSPAQSNFGGRIYATPEEDHGLMMRERERERDREERELDKGWSEEKTDSMGKVGGVGVGVTQPKRRLSRAMSSNSVASSPRSPPNEYRHSSPYSRTNPPILDDKMGMITYAAVAAAASREQERPPTLWGIELKWISLMTLALQNALLTIIMHYSRISTSPNHTYSAAAAVLLNELLKGGISILIALKRIDSEMNNTPSPAVYSERLDEKRRLTSKLSIPSLFHFSRLASLYNQVFSRDCWKLSVPAILYVIQNNLQYVAASNLDVATFQVTYQMKILTTAFFSVLFLGRRLSRAKWASLVLLAVGVGIVQLQSTSSPTHSHSAHSAAHVKTNHGKHQLRSEIIPDESILTSMRVMHPITGFLAVTMACMTSGLAGVYFEYILKSSKATSIPAAPQPDLWVRNTQLSLFSLLPALVPIVVNPPGPDSISYVRKVLGCFANFNGWAIGTVLTQTFGGLITALVIKYSDNIMKGFATSLSIIISFLASVALFSYPITLTFVIGASIVLFATYSYNSPAQNPPSRAAVAVAPDSPILTSAPIIGEPEKPSRTPSVINLLGLGSNGGSRKPSMTDIRSYTPPQAGRMDRNQGIAELR